MCFTNYFFSLLYISYYCILLLYHYTIYKLQVTQGDKKKPQSNNTIESNLLLLTLVLACKVLQINFFNLFFTYTQKTVLHSTWRSLLPIWETETRQNRLCSERMYLWNAGVHWEIFSSHWWLLWIRPWPCLLILSVDCYCVWCKQKWRILPRIQPRLSCGAWRKFLKWFGNSILLNLKQPRF